MIEEKTAARSHTGKVKMSNYLNRRNTLVRDFLKIPTGNHKQKEEEEDFLNQIRDIQNNIQS